MSEDEKQGGLGTSAMRRLIDAASELGVLPLEATVSADNEDRAAVAAVLRKAGFDCNPPYSEALVRVLGSYTTYLM